MMLVWYSFNSNWRSKLEVITKNNVYRRWCKLVYFRVINAPKADARNTNYILLTSQFAQAALRDVANVDMDDLLAKRRDFPANQRKLLMPETDR